MPLVSALAKALKGSAYISNLKVFSFEAKPIYGLPTVMAASQALQVWIIERAPHIKALRLFKSGPRLAACALGLQHLKHMEMQAHAFVEGVSISAMQLPACLETLFLHDEGMHTGIDVLGFHRLRRLVVEGRYVLRILHNSNCHVGLHVHHADDLRLHDDSLAVLRRTAEATRDLVLSFPSGFDERTQDPPMFEHFANLETLTVNWPVFQSARTLGKIQDLPMSGARATLSRCMPLNGRPLASLKSLLIVSEGAMQCFIPKALHKLEELVLFSKGLACVSFEESHATLARVEIFYVLGQPLAMDMLGSGMHEVQVNMAKRGLAMSNALAKEAKKDVRCNSSCIYLRPVAAPELSFEEAYERVSRVARQCRCKACFDCLRRAGCLTWS